MPNTVTTSLVVSFTRSGNGGGILSAEIDSRQDGFNSGNTSFAPGNQPAFLIFKSSDVEIDEITPSAGEISDLGTGTMSVTEIIKFANVAEATLSKPVASGLTVKWLGNDLGAVTLVGENKLVVAAPGVGVLKVTYNAAFLAKKLVNVDNPLNGETEYEVLIYIEGHSGS